MTKPTAPAPRRLTPKRVVKMGLQLGGAAVARVRTLTSRPPRFTGVFPTREAAIAAMPTDLKAGYDNQEIADVSFQQMCELAVWDYPVVFWLDRLLSGRGTLIDAGGHQGTKFIAFKNVLDLRDLQWVVYDLPGIVSVARKRQADGMIPSEIQFQTQLSQLPPADALLASGLLQYLDCSFSSLVQDLPQPPRIILLNKVALRDGPAVFTHERIGHTRVPYHIRSRKAWEAEIAALGYCVRDSWDIPDLGHVISTHPWQGRSESRGYVLERCVTR